MLTLCAAHRSAKSTPPFAADTSSTELPIATSFTLDDYGVGC
ncbi:MAG: hypothetical protein AVDCRST_MAG59-2138, partial [uncultured Thermomicrobiales bacterium]